MESTIAAKNRQIIGETYRQVREDVYSIFRQACIAEDTCEDLTQDVFLKMLSLDLIIPEHAAALAANIAYHKRTDYLRHRAYINKVQNDSLWRMEQSYTNTEAEVNDILQVEMKAIQCMKEQDAHIYRMSRFEDKTADEIVIETGLTKRAVESRIYRTRNLVRERIRKAINF